MAITASESQAPPTSATAHHHRHHSAAKAPSAAPASLEVESVKCASCGFTEDCTLAYISRVRERHHGRWVCGLCAEAVKDEASRAGTHISAEEALKRHITFFQAFRSSAPPGEGSDHPISAIGRILRRSLDAPRTALRSNSASSLEVAKMRVSEESPLVRSGSCFSSFSS